MHKRNTEGLIRGFTDPEVAKEAAKKSHEAWKKNGRKPRGFAANPELARRAALKSAEKARQNKIRAKQEEA